MSIRSNRPLLYSFRRCPYAIRARMALNICSLPYDQIEVDLKNKPDEMLKISPSKTVPVLKLSEDKVIDESLDIMLYALSKNDPEGWLNLTADQREETDRLIVINDGEFKKWLDCYKYHSRFPEHSQSYYQEKGARILRDLNKKLSQHAGLIKDRLTLADYAIMPFIRQWHHVDQTHLETYPSLLKWLNNLLNSNVFIRAMKA